MKSPGKVSEAYNETQNAIEDKAINVGFDFNGSDVKSEVSNDYGD